MERSYILRSDNGNDYQITRLFEMVARRNVRTQEWPTSIIPKLPPSTQSPNNLSPNVCTARTCFLFLVVGIASFMHYSVVTLSLSDWFDADFRLLSRWLSSYHEDLPRCATINLIRPVGAPFNGTWTPQPRLATEPKFRRYLGLEGRPPSIPTWIVTPGNVSSTIRFYDTSPFSPSGKYLAFLRFPRDSEGKSISGSALLPAADVVLVNLWSGVKSIIAKTHGWDSQTGAHVQWGASDDDLFYNDVVWDARLQAYRAIGVHMNAFRKKKKQLECPVYQVGYLAHALRIISSYLSPSPSTCL